MQKLVEKKLSIEEIFLQFIKTQQQLIQSQQASIKNFENQIDQLACALNKRPPGILPSNTQVSKMEDEKQCKALKLKSGKELPESYKVPEPETKKSIGGQCIEENNKDGWVEVHKPISEPTPIKYVPKISYPQRLQKKARPKSSVIFEYFQKMSVNIPFVKELEQMPSYTKFIKQILSKKKSVEQFATVALNEECSAVLQRKQLIS